MKHILILLISLLTNMGIHGDAVSKPIKNENPAVFSRTTSITLNGEIEQIFPLFTPYKESLWAPNWEIEEITPQNKVIGKGFTFKPKDSDSFWIISQFDQDTYKIQYTIFDVPRNEFRIIDISLTSSGETTTASISYTITSTKEKNLKYAKNEWSTKNYRQKILSWQTMINQYLMHN